MLQSKKLRRLLLVGLVALLPCGAVRAEWGDLTGQFVLDGEIPKPIPILVTKDQQVCGLHKLVDEALAVNPDNKGIYGVVIYLEIARGKKAPESHPDYAATATAEVVLDNTNCRFEPHVALLRTTQTLVVGNKDPIGHNVKIDTLKNPPINPIVPANGQVTQKFPQEERMPTNVSCSIHPWMNAILLVKESPYMAASDADGKFVIKNLPVGKWSFKAWQGKWVNAVALGGKATKWDKGSFDVEIKPGTNDLGVVKVAPSVFKR